MAYLGDISLFYQENIQNFPFILLSYFWTIELQSILLSSGVIQELNVKLVNVKQY